MKKFSLYIWVVGIMASLVSLTSCDIDSDYDEVRRPTALVTVYPQGANGFYMQLDSVTTLVPTNLKSSPFGEKTVRALVNYNEESGSNGGVKNVKVNWIDSIRTKLPVATTGENDDKAFGNDPIEIVRDWVTVAEDGYITLRIRTIWGNGSKHEINLVTGTNKDNVYELTLRHNANGDLQGRYADALVAFDLNSLYKNHGDKVKLRLNWQSFSGKKSLDVSLKMHSAKTKVMKERLPMCSRID